MQLTVAVCTFNPDRDLIVRAIAAIAGQLPLAAEILVIDNNSKPPLAEGGFLNDYPVRLIRESRQGLTAAREAAIRSARGEVILFADDDNILADGYLAAAVSAFASDPRLGLLGGRVMPEYESPPPRWALEFEQQLAIRRFAPTLYVETTDVPFSEYFPVGAGFAVRRTLACAYLEDCARTATIEGRFGGELSAGEDIDLALFVLSEGQKLAVNGALALTHVIPTSRLSSRYLARLCVGSIKSTFELDRKWATRFGRPIFLDLAMPLPGLVVRTVSSFMLRPWSPRYAVKYATFRALLGFRMARGGWRL